MKERKRHTLVENVGCQPEQMKHVNEQIISRIDYCCIRERAREREFDISMYAHLYTRVRRRRENMID